MRHLAALSFLAACNLDAPGPDYAAVLPDERLAVEIPDDVQTLRTGALEVSEFYLEADRATRDINGGLVEILVGVREITTFDPTWSDEREDTALWGPWENDENTVARLWVHHDRARDTWEWALEIRRIKDTDADWTPVIVGDVEAGASKERSAGHLAIDFDTIDGMGTGDGEVGIVVSDYELREDGATVQVAFEGFADEETGERADALYSYDHTAGVGGFLDLAYTTDEVSTPEPELAVVRTRWDAEGAGRGDAYLTGGDLGPLTYQASECWGADKIVVFSENNAELEREGDEALCVFAEANFPE